GASSSCVALYRALPGGKRASVEIIFDFREVCGLARRPLRRTRRTMTVAVLTGAALVAGGGGATALARTSPRIVVKDGVTQPVFSYKDAIREHVYVESSVDSDRDGKRDLVRSEEHTSELQSREKLVCRP